MSRETGIVGHWREPHPWNGISWPPLPPEWLGPPADFQGVIWPAGGDDPVPVLRLFAIDMRDGAPLPDIGAQVEFSLGTHAVWPCAFDVVVIED